MSLSNDLIKEFAVIVNDKQEDEKDDILYGKVVILNDKKYVKLDGSDLLTPISGTNADVKNNERVSIVIKNHQITINGNISSPAARTDDVKEIGNKVVNIEADNIVVNQKLTANSADIETLKTTKLSATDADIKYATIENLKAANATIENLKATKLDVDTAKANYATINNLNAANAAIKKLEVESAVIDDLEADYGEFKYLTTDNFKATNGEIENLKVNKLDAESADIRYANIDFSNIGKAAIETFYANSGLIKDVIVGDGTITGELVGVTIKGDIIEGNTIVADKLVIKGEDGLYYKLNTNGVTTESEQTDYNSLNGSIITAKSITATKIAVDDLVAFDATIGGFNITNTSIYSGVKESADNTTRGIYLDNQGQINIGDSNNFFKYYKDQNGTYKLEISAASVKITSSNKNIETALGEMITKNVEEFYQSTSPLSLSGGSWSTEQPTWKDGTYIWRRTAVTYGDGHSEYLPSSKGVCITGNTGSSGEDATTLRIDSSRGTVFKNNTITTVLSAVIYKGSKRITDIDALKKEYGSNAYLQWSWQRMNEETFGTILLTDNRIGNSGFTLTLTPADVDTKVTFMCQLITD